MIDYDLELMNKFYWWWFVLSEKKPSPEIIKGKNSGLNGEKESQRLLKNPDLCGILIVEREYFPIF